VRTAVSIWNGRIAPVFDVSRKLLVLEIERAEVVTRKEEPLPGPDPGDRIARLSALKVEELICGAISRPLHEMVLAHGIRVIPFVKGDLGEVIQAWLKGELENEAFLMPGCCGRGRRRGFMAGAGMGREGTGIKGKGRGGMGRGGGAGRRGQNRGFTGGPLAAGPSGFCVCPQCGHREEHQRGVPCVGRQCPRCGTAMTRE